MMMLQKASLNFRLTLKTNNAFTVYTVSTNIFFCTFRLMTTKMEVEDLHQEIARLKRELAEKNAAIESLVVKLRAYESKDSIQVSDGAYLPSLPKNQELTNQDIAKFSR